MSTNFFKLSAAIRRWFAGVLMVALLLSVLPPAAFADENTPATDSGTEQSTTSTSTPETTGTATSSETTGDTASSTNNGSDGADGSQTTDGDSASSTSTSTASSTDPQDGAAGEEGNTGADGTTGQGTSGDTQASPEDGEPVEVTSDSLINDLDDDEDEEEEETGHIIDYTGGTSLIETDIATARGEIFTDANSNDVRSDLTAQAASGDLDFYTFNATGTNEAVVDNNGVIVSSTGDNQLSADKTNTAIITGDAISALNVANIINTNVVNSDGLIYLGNQILQTGESLDLTDSFFPDPDKPFATVGTCSLLSCAAEDIVYNISHVNTATVTNQALVEASTGANVARGGLFPTISTGDAYASANIMNVVNTNIIDSNYQLMTFNAIGDLEGDLILPTEALFNAYFAQPNGYNQLEDARDATIDVTNNNDAVIDNDLDTYGQTGNNDSLTDFEAAISTGRSETESNILNKVNDNTFGGDSFYILVRVHGAWDGDVVGLPAGLTWNWTPDGVVIYNEDAEISPSQMLGYDVDSYSAYINNQNDELYLKNDITLSAVTGENAVEQGTTGAITTGNAFASANVMNIANTNIIATNLTYAVINIMGDFEGNISFSATDLALSGSVADANNPAAPGDTLTYSYTITNNSNEPATNVLLEQTLQNAQTTAGEIVQSTNLGTIAPGSSKNVSLSALVSTNLPYGISTSTAYAKVTSSIGDSDFTNNLVKLTRLISHPDPSNNTSTTTQDTGTTTDETDTNTDPTDTNTGGGDVSTPPSSGGGGGGGGGGDYRSSYKKKSMERELKDVDPNQAPFLVVKKTADIKEGATIKAGDSVDYEIVVSNTGGTAYDATVFDILRNPLGSEVNSQHWDLGTILPGEEIKLTYTTQYDKNTPSGVYTNTASIEAYRKENYKEDGKDALRIDDAVFTVQIDGVSLAIGDVGTIAFFPTADGQVAALLTWQTSTSSLSRMYYGPYQTISQYNQSLPNFGYQSQSVMFPEQKTTHYMIIMGLKAGTSYGYRIYSKNKTDTKISREYTFVVPYLVNKLTLAVPATPSPAPQIAGASTFTPAYQAPTPQPTYQAPAPKPVYKAPTPTVTPPKPKPQPVPEPQPEPEPEPQPEPEPSSGGGFFSKVTNFFGW